MHPLERGYLAFAQRFGKQLDEAEARYRAEANVHGEDVDLVCLSRRSALQFVGAGPHDAHFVDAVRFAAQLQAWSAYRRHRHLYVLNERLAEALAQASWPEALDVSSLFLPVPGAAISVRLPAEAAQSHFIGFYDVNPGLVVQSQIRFVRLQQDGVLVPSGGVLLSGGSLEQAIQAETNDAKRYVERRRSLVGLDPVGAHLDREMRRLDGEMQSRGRLLRHLLNVLLYIHGNEDVVAKVHPGSKPKAGAARPRSIRRARDKAAVAIFDVGRAFATTLQHWEEEQSRAAVVGAAADQSRVRPHVRRAHLHLYWTGRGREVPKFQLVRPTLVRGGNAGEVHSMRRVR